MDIISDDDPRVHPEHCWWSLGWTRLGTILGGVNIILWDQSGEIIHKYNSVVHQSIMRRGHR